MSVERTEQKRNYFTCTGYFGKKKNLDYFSQKESNVKTKKKAQFKPPFKSTKEAKADFQNQDKVDKQKSEYKSAPKKKTPVNRKQNKSQVAVKNEKVAKMSENGPDTVVSTSGLCQKEGNTSRHRI